MAHLGSPEMMSFISCKCITILIQWLYYFIEDVIQYSCSIKCMA